MEVLLLITKNVEWMCRYCGQKIVKSEKMGRPAPGKCPRKTGDKPHSWVINRKF